MTEQSIVAGIGHGTERFHDYFPSPNSHQGGRLQRHSTTANAATQRQKQHFARVAQNLRSGGPKFKSPVKWSIFDHLVEDRKQSQRKPSAAQQRIASSRERSASISRPLGHIENVQTSASPEVRLSTRSVVNRVNQHISKSYERDTPGRVPDDDLYNATPPPKHMKRQREESVALSEVESFVEQPQVETVAEKRRRLLRKGDWVGTSIQKPLQIAFASPRDEENIGRRRRVPHGGHRARYEKRQAHMSSPFAPRTRCPDDIAPSVWARQQQQHAIEKSDVRISIGGRLVPPGLSSSSIPPPALSRHRSQDTQSDVMLLDNNNTPRSHNHQRPVQHYLPSYNHSQVSGKASRVSQNSIQEEEQHVISHIEEYSDDLEGWAGIASDSNIELRNANKHMHSQLRDGKRTYSQGKEATPTESANNILPHMMFSSSSASIHHPIPRSSRISSLIRSDSPEVARSTIAQVGTRKPAVPSSQLEENGVWESWIAPLYEEPPSPELDDYDNRRHNAEVNVSPGISTAPRQKPVKEDDMSQYEGYSSGEYLDSAEFVEELGPEIPEPRSPASSSRSGQEFEIVEVRPNTAHETDVPQIVEKPDTNLEKREEDTDDVWRKFVFGSSSEVMEEHTTELMPSTHGWEGHQSTTGSSIRAQAPYSDRDVRSSANHSTSLGALHYQPNGKSGSHCNNSESQDSPTSDSPSENRDPTRTSASVAVHASSSSDLASSSERSIDHRPKKRILFTKPRPFMGRNASAPPPEEEPLHIGKHLLDRERRTRSVRSEEDDIYSLMNNDGDDDDVESIEDA